MIRLSLLFFLVSSLVFSQEIETAEDDAVYVSETLLNSQGEVNTKNPLRASLYSAVVPGLGQVYNEKYWKVPIVWGLIGAGLGVTIHNNDRFHHYRDAFISELNGEEHEYTGIFDASRLGEIQDDMRRNRDYAIALTIVAYALNVIDATVDAHLFDIRRDRDLSVDPTAFVDPSTGNTNIGLAVKFNFK